MAYERLLYDIDKQKDKYNSLKKEYDAALKTSSSNNSQKRETSVSTTYPSNSINTQSYSSSNNRIITIEKRQNIKINRGETITLKYSDSSKSIRFESDQDGSVITLDKNGTVKGKSKGKANVWFYDGNTLICSACIIVK